MMPCWHGNKIFEHLAWGEPIELGDARRRRLDYLVRLRVASNPYRRIAAQVYNGRLWHALRPAARLVEVTMGLRTLPDWARGIADGA